MSNSEPSIQEIIDKNNTLLRDLLAEEIRAIEEFIKVANRGSAAPIKRKTTFPLTFHRSTHPSQNNGNKKPSISLLQLIEAYEQAPENQKSDDRAKKNSEYKKFILSIMGGSTALSEIDTNRVRDLAKVLDTYPANASKFYPGKSPKEIHELLTKKPSTKPCLSETTKRNYLRYFAAILNWAHTEGHIDRVPMPKGLLKNKPTQEKKRDSLTIEDIATLLTDSKFVSYKESREPHKYWIPIISLFTGMRLSEILEMRLVEVSVEDDTQIKYFNLSASGDRSLKTSQSARRIPIPDILIEAGLWDYYQEAMGSRNGLLFSKASKTENPSDTFSKWWARELKRLNIKRAGITFHSFRHTYRDAIRHIEPSSYDAKLANLLGGWKSRDIGENYGTGDTLENLSRVQNRICNEGLKKACELIKGVRHA